MWNQFLINQRIYVAQWVIALIVLNLFSFYVEEKLIIYFVLMNMNANSFFFFERNVNANIVIIDSNQCSSTMLSKDLNNGRGSFPIEILLIFLIFS